MKGRIPLLAHMVHLEQNVLVLSQVSKLMFRLKGLNVPVHLTVLAHPEEASTEYQELTQTSKMSSQVEEGVKSNRNSKSTIYAN